ncbi:hypothetical protein MPSEU_000842200 [Mayamaea pseudoterrestris]|nr:hypothetical protein MPSEU_000842200 [Mayamaea pseudoterrestris]
MTSTSECNEETKSFLSELPTNQVNDIKDSIDRFVLHHATSHRPMVLVSSGGTSCDLELHVVRCLDNFSTGHRGAICVEQFLERGYAVIHLWRSGSASPYARVLTQLLGVQVANHALNIDSLEQLFANATLGQEEEYVNTVLEQDKFLSNPVTNDNDGNSNNRVSHDNNVLRRQIQHSPKLLKALTERATAVREHRLLTISFRTVEEYLGYLELAATSLDQCRSLATFFLAAAVSDFYVPRSERSEHKIHASDSYTLHLTQVPKMIGTLRRTWAPEAFVTSFKLETDAQVLRNNSERAVTNYGCHLVVGNLLQSRHDKVYILQPHNFRQQNPTDASTWNMVELVKPTTSDDSDVLESQLVDVVVQAHFDYISWHYQANDGAAAKAILEAQSRLEQTKRRLHREQVWTSMRNMVAELAGVALALAFSYTINEALQAKWRGK